MTTIRAMSFSCQYNALSARSESRTGPSHPPNDDAVSRKIDPSTPFWKSQPHSVRAQLASVLDRVTRNSFVTWCSLRWGHRRCERCEFARQIIGTTNFHANTESALSGRNDEPPMMIEVTSQRTQSPSQDRRQLGPRFSDTTSCRRSSTPLVDVWFWYRAAPFEGLLPPQTWKDLWCILLWMLKAEVFEISPSQVNDVAKILNSCRSVARSKTQLR